MINSHKEMKQCLLVELCIGILTNLRKILCGLSVASQELSCSSQDEGGSSANRRRGRCRGGACQAGRGDWSYRSAGEPNRLRAFLRAWLLLCIK